MSILLLFQQEAVVCMWWIQKESHCCEGQLSASGENRECHSLSIERTLSSVKKLGKSASDTFEMIKLAYGKEALGCSAMFKWHKRFAQGRDSLDHDEHTSQPRVVMNS
jgi:hypothetical protein